MRCSIINCRGLWEIFLNYNFLLERHLYFFLSCWVYAIVANNIFRMVSSWSCSNLFSSLKTSFFFHIFFILAWYKIFGLHLWLGIHPLQHLRHLLLFLSFSSEFHCLLVSCEAVEYILIFRYLMSGKIDIDSHNLFH